MTELVVQQLVPLRLANSLASCRYRIWRGGGGVGLEVIWLIYWTGLVEHKRKIAGCLQLDSAENGQATLASVALSVLCVLR